MSPARLAIVERLAELIRAVECPHPTRVAVDGPDAAGKTTLADELASTLADGGREVLRASIDGFHRPRKERYRQGADSPEGYFHDSFDYEQLGQALLNPLGPGGDLRYCTRVFDYKDDSPDRAPSLLASPDSTLIFDGVFLLRPELVSAWDFRIFVIADFDEILRRARLRDTGLFGSVYEVERRYRLRYLPAQQIYFRTARPAESADIVVDNNNPDSPLVLERRGNERERRDSNPRPPA